MSAPIYKHLNALVERDQMTADQRAVIDAPERDLGIEIADVSGILCEIGATLDWMGSKGWHARIKSPFTPGNLWWAGFTPHGVSGWNGSPDHQVGDVTLRGALWRAVLLTLMSGPANPEALSGQERLL